MGFFVTKILKEWQYTGELILSLFERAGRYKLHVPIPHIIQDVPFKIKSAQDFVSSLEAIQDWSI